MEYTGAFLKMLTAYERELGAAFPSANRRSVLLVLRECNQPSATSQKQVEDATKIPQPNVSQLMKKMIAWGWLEVSKRDPKTGKKKVHISLLGQGVLSDFEEGCRKAAKNVPKMKVSKT